jgi:tetratricopeptide (TPR) repeat protein
LALTLDLPVFFSRWLFGRFSFGEAAWAAMNSLSWQSVAIGDPLYRPFARSPQQLHAELDRRESPLVDWSHVLVVNRNQRMNAPPDQLVQYLLSLPRTRHSAVLTEKLGDLYWAQKHFTDALDTYDMALDCHPTLPQKKRLLLRLARLRYLFGPETKVLDYYQTLLKEYPDYPDKLSVYRTMLPVARRAGDEDLAARCEKQIEQLSPK